MNENKTELKQRVVAWLYPDMIQNMEAMIQAKNMKNHTEFISQAVDFYIGYLARQNSTSFFYRRIYSEPFKVLLQNTENRVANNLFRLSVEISMMMHLLAATLEVTDSELQSLRGRCVAEVKKTRGKIKLDDAVLFQQGVDI